MLKQFGLFTFQFKKNIIFRLTGTIIVIVLITYIPYLAQWQVDILVHRDVSELSNGDLAFSWFGRLDLHTHTL